MSHLTAEERNRISTMHLQGKRQKEIASAVGRSKSVISTELKRNRKPDGSYSCYHAQKMADQRKQNKPTRASPITAELAEEILEKFAEQHSPEQIVGTMKRQGRENTPSLQTIYNHINKDRAQGGELYKRLRHKGKKRIKRKLGKSAQGQIIGRVDISERPAEVEQRKRLGDYEADLIIGSGTGGNLLTVNCRVTGRLMMVKVPNKEAATIERAMIKLLEEEKPHLKTITTDNGKEFAKHREIKEKLGIGYYFARAYSSWQRGSNENLNGLVREYFPKGMDLGEVTKEQVKIVLNKLNNRPRKRYNFLSPNEVFKQKILQN